MSEFTSAADDLVEEGLRLYSHGQLDQALAKWQLALGHVPDLRRAQEYIQYVQENRRELEQTFAAAQVMMGQRRGDQRIADKPVGVSPGKPTPLVKTTVQRGGAAGGNLLSEMDWGRVRRPLQEESSAPSDRFRKNTPAVLTRDLADEDLTPRIDIHAQNKLLRGQAVAPPLAKKPHAETGRVLMPMATEDLAGDFDAPEPTTGKLGHGPIVELGLAATNPLMMPLAEGNLGLSGVKAPSPEMAAIEPDTDEASIDGGSETPSSIFERSPKNSSSPDSTDRRASGFEFSSAVTSDILRSSVGTESLMEERGPPPSVLRPPPLPIQGLDDEDERPLDVPAVGGMSPRSTLPLGVDSSRAARRGSHPRLIQAPANNATANLGMEESLEGMLEGARQLFEQGTFDGSLWLCERVLTKDEANKHARDLLERNQQMLLRQYQEKLSDLNQVPIVRIPQQEIIWHKLDHRAGFLLSRVDGVLSYGDILDISGMSNFEAYRILTQLVDQGVIGSAR